MSQRGYITVAVITLVLGVWTSPVSAQKVYWTGYMANNIQRANLDGSHVEDVVSYGVVSPLGLALDLAAGKMYWTEAGTHRIQRANLDGTDVEILVVSGLENPREIAVDPLGGKMYWTDTFTGKVQRANLNGTNVEDLVVITDSWPRGIALDLAADKMYWTESKHNVIRRADLDGGNIEELVATGFMSLRDIVLDTAAGKMYWTDRGANRIQRANLNGSAVENLITTGLADPFGLMLDVAVGKMYWVDGGTGKVQRADLDGTGVEDLVTGLGFIIGIELDLECLAQEDDCQPNGVPDECDIGAGASGDCNGNGIPDECDIAEGLSEDCRGDGVPDECEPDCNGNDIADSCDIDAGTSDDCTNDGIPDECEPDCNLNGFADSCDIASGTSEDCTGNGVPDECDPDCDGNGIPDTCEFADCNHNCVPDEYEIGSTIGDCNENMAPDECDIADGISNDCTGNGIPDECESDCDNNGIPDVCELASGVELPCAIIEFAPGGSTGPFEIVGNEMIIPEGGLQVEYEILVSGWGNAPDSPLLGGFNMVVEGVSMLGVNALPSNPGVDLTTTGYVDCATATDCPFPDPLPVTESGTCGVIFPGYCDDFGAAFFLPSVCSNDLRLPCRTHDDCPGAGLCVDNPRFVYPSEFDPLLGIIHLGGNTFQWLGLPWLNAVERGREDPDGVTRFLAGNLRIIVPEDARGTYTIRFRLGLDFTFIIPPDTGVPISATVIHGQLTIGGACCAPDDSCEILLEGECEAAGGEFLGGFCGDDADGDGIPDACDPCPNDNPDDTDGDGVCNSDDGCPLDANKTAPGLCGCGFDDDGDSDGDGISDCDDQCPGIDDAIFAPECVDTIPTVSTWGIVTLALSLLIGGKLTFGRKHAHSD